MTQDRGRTDDSDRWLLTGARGFLGKRVLYRLAERGIPVRALIRPGSPPDEFDAMKAEFPDANLDVVYGPLGDRAALDGVGTVLHLAAAKSGSPAAQVANTVLSSDRLYRVSIEAGVRRFVLVSSFGVIGASGLPRGGLLDERTPMDPHPELRDPYSFAKHRQEQLAWKYRQDSGLPLVVIRPGWIFGPGQNILGPRIGLNLSGLFIHLGGDNMLPLTYVDNCADAVVHAGRILGLEGQVFCLVDDSLPTSRDLFRRYRREVRAIAYVDVPYPLLRFIAWANALYSERTQGHLPPVFTPYKVKALWAGHHYSNRKAKEMLDWAPRVPMQKALELTFAAQLRDCKI
jgi:dihydroflavonol-4-reductase